MSPLREGQWAGMHNTRTLKLEQLNGIQPSPVLFPPWHAKTSSDKKGLCTCWRAELLKTKRQFETECKQRVFVSRDNCHSGEEQKPPNRKIHCTSETPWESPWWPQEGRTPPLNYHHQRTKNRLCAFHWRVKRAWLSWPLGWCVAFFPPPLTFQPIWSGRRKVRLMQNQSLLQQEDAEEEEVLYDCIIILLSKTLCLCLSDPFVILIHTGLAHLAISYQCTKWWKDILETEIWVLKKWEQSK